MLGLWSIRPLRPGLGLSSTQDLTIFINYVLASVHVMPLLCDFVRSNVLLPYKLYGSQYFILFCDWGGEIYLIPVRSATRGVMGSDPTSILALPGPWLLAGDSDHFL
jgi:hypothetical protein